MNFGDFGMLHVQISYSCADPDFFVGGGSSSDGQETALITLFLVLNLFLYFSKDSEGVHFFQRGGGGQMLISIETHIT